MGYYQGKGARLVWQSAEIAGKVQQPCPVTAGINMVSCANWTPSVTLTVSAAFVPGDYLIKLVGSGGQQSYVPLTVWDPSSTATYVVQNDVLTWQAWTLEYPLVRFAEQHGLDVTCVTDQAVAQHPRYLLRHRVLLTLGHDECWSLSERTAVVAAHDGGMNIVFFGPARSCGMSGSSPRDASSWVYRGTGLRDGSTVPGVIGSDVDRFYPAMIHPAGLQVLSHSPIPAGLGQTVIGPFYSDITYYTDAAGGAGVLDTGTTN